MLRALAVIAVAAVPALAGCSGAVLDPPCGSQRGVSVHETLPNIIVDLSLVDERDRPDGISWEIIPPDLGPITAVHLHDAIPGHGDRMLFDLTSEDIYPADGITVVGSDYYSFDSGIDALFTLVRTGATYIDVHTGSQADPAIRVDLTNVQFQDWSDYYCS